MTKTCIRVFADVEQIKQCKEELKNVDRSVSRIARALNMAGNEVRLKILFLLNQESKMCPCDLSDILGMTVPAISQHLKKLKDAELVETNKVGQTIFYSISMTQGDNLQTILNLIETDKTTVS